MLFNSYVYIFFSLPASFGIYFFLTHKRLLQAAKAWLVLCSLFFYAYWNAAYLPLILISIVFNYAVGTALIKSGKKSSEGIPIRPRRTSRKGILCFGVTANLLLLGYYKYTDFFISNLRWAAGLNLPLLHIALPLGISFFTFTQIAFLVDSYREECQEYDFLNYGLFVTFFPHLIAGPILHHKDLMPQFDRIKNKVLNYKNISAGLFIFSIGLCKKVLIADTVAVWANQGFDHSSLLTFGEAWMISLSYSLQLYFDFSGYIDMAIGSALLFNIQLPINFDSPYQATTIQDFWRRWHITLSRFLRDYIYIPLGGNQHGEWRTVVNLMVTFLLGGLWHGASWTFVFWGALHGLAMVIHRIWGGFGIKMNRFLAWFLTFNFVNAAWVFFRAKTWEDAVHILRGMAGCNGFGISADFRTQIPTVLGLTAAVLILKNSSLMRSTFQPSWKTAALCTFLACAGIISITKVSEFIYFNF